MKLFWRIFLSFWLATGLMILAVAIAGELWPPTSRGERETFDPALTQSLLVDAVDAYEQQGAAALSSHLQSLATLRHRPFDLFDQDGKILLGQKKPPRYYAALAKEVRQSGRVELQPYFGLRTLFVCPIQSASGRTYAAVFPIFEPRSRLLRARFWFNLAVAMLPAALVCMALSLYLTRPITTLRTTAQFLAAGDLSARAAPPITKRGDELGDLARDFDVMASQIQSLMTAQRRFVADVSHELGAPLTRMHLALALLQRQFASNNSVELDRIQRETGKLTNLVQQLLFLAGMEAGSCPAENLAPVSTRSLCESIVEDANFEAAQAHCRLTGSRQDVELLAYPQLLRRAIDNVLRNAIRYSPPESEIIFNCRVEGHPQQVTFQILDCGPGVPESMLTNIFRPFFRTAPGRENNGGGTGLGLAIAAEAIRLHDGTIMAANRKGGGLQVTISLPYRRPVQLAHEEPVAKACDA